MLSLVPEYRAFPVSKSPLPSVDLTSKESSYSSIIGAEIPSKVGQADRIEPFDSQCRGRPESKEAEVESLYGITHLRTRKLHYTYEKYKL